MKMLVMRKSSIPVRPLITLEEAFTRVKMRAVIQKMFYSFHISCCHIFLLEQHVITKILIQAATAKTLKGLYLVKTDVYSQQISKESFHITEL